MSKFLQIVKAAGVLAGVVVLGLLVGWLVTRGDQPSGSHQTAPPGSGQTSTISPPLPPPTAYTNEIGSGTTPPVPTNRPPVIASTPSQTNLITDWDPILDTVLGREDEDASAKAKQLLALFPRLPEEGQTTFAQHLANLTDDKDFPSTLAPYLTATNTPGAVLDILLADLLNRPNNIKLPILLDVARSCPDQKAAGEAKEILTLFLDEDHGSDWPAWDTDLKKWLADNPD